MPSLDLPEVRKSSPGDTRARETLTETETGLARGDGARAPGSFPEMIPLKVVQAQQPNHRLTARVAGGRGGSGCQHPRPQTLADSLLELLISKT